MTSSPPPDPRSSQRVPLGFDEFVGIFVAFTTVGAILLWSLSQKNGDLSLTSILSPSSSPSAQTTPTPSLDATGTEAPVLPLPTVTPTQLPEALTQVPTQTPIGRIPVVPLPRTSAPAPPETTTAPKPISFVDVPQDYWARPFIDALSARGIVSGFAGDYFRPDRPVTRAEFAAIVQDAFDQNYDQNKAEFKDIPANFWAVRAIDKATQTGFLKGYPGNVFQPQQQIPKAQVLVALASGLKLASPSSPTQVLQFYKDAAQIPSYATEKIAAATTAGLVANYPEPSLLDPNRKATRAEVAAIIHQALVQAGKIEPVQSQYVVRGNS